jgi:ssDNA thymidine ADP-ribosyltransferase, DarT
MTMIETIKQEVERRRITRLCHFTPSRNLVHILTGITGILATKKLQKDERSVFTSTDLERFDRHEEYICCSIEYPNAWYFDKAKSKDELFKDWVILFINPKYLWLPGTRFCPRNAASGHGRNVAEGEQAFLSMFAESVPGAYNRNFTRSNTHLACCPTDNQAEVLIPDQIGTADILAIAVPTENQAKNEVVRLSILGVPTDTFNFVIAPTLFDKQSLSDAIRSGKRPIETAWILRNEI